MRKKIKIKHRLTNEIREAFLTDDDEVVSERGDEYSFKKWVIIDEPIWPLVLAAIFFIGLLAWAISEFGR